MQAAATVEEDRLTQEILAKFCKGEDVTHYDTLHLRKCVPILQQFISACLQNDKTSCMADHCRRTVQELVSLVVCMMAPFTKTQSRTQKDPPPQIDNLFEDYAFFPNIPQYWQLCSGSLVLCLGVVYEFINFKLMFPKNVKQHFVTKRRIKDTILSLPTY